MPSRSLSLAGIPELRGSAAASRYRKSSVTDPIRRPSIAPSGQLESDLLLDPITVSQIVNLGNHVDSGFCLTSNAISFTHFGRVSTVLE
ncbi:hypothetical protein ANCCAN_11803 [Ancylostoma caninum]|uniref:Uncharacterized protein n=1 Tax=Ancylostoma caninum TaxID=29170 RepID=A0A368GEW7_ANCCA|nr:hypothetical protein ANCCAN_11803 [Ancylostoma caninum]